MSRVETWRALDLMDSFRWTNYKSWNNATREGIKQFNLASMDALQVRTLIAL